MLTVRPNFVENELSSDLSTNVNDIASLKFTNLTIGKIYLLTGMLFYSPLVTSGNLALDMNNDTETIHLLRLNFQAATPQNSDRSCAVSIVFDAKATSVTFDWDRGGSGVLWGNGSSNETYLRLLQF